MKKSFLTSILVAAASSAALPTAADARRVWADVQPVAGASVNMDGNVAASANGDAFASWSAEPDGDPTFGPNTYVAIRTPGSAPQTQLLDAGGNGAANLFADEQGNAMAVWSPAAAQEEFALRTAGGSFGAAQPLPVDPVGIIDVASNKSGQVAIVYRRQAAGFGIDVLFGTVTGGFPDPAVPLANVSGEVSLRATKLTEDGELVFAWVDSPDFISPGVLHVTSRRATGPVADEALTGASVRATSLSVGVDAAGAAVVSWADAADAQARGKIAERAPGGSFTTRDMPIEVSATDEWALAMASDGTITVAGAGGIWSMTRGGDATRLRTLLNGPHLSPRFATSTGPATVLTLRVNQSHWVAFRRSGSGPLAYAEDLRPGCEPTATADLAVDGNGRAAALIQDTSSTVFAIDSEVVGDPTGGCASNELYGDGSTAPPPSGGSWPPPPGWTPSPTPSYTGRLGLGATKIKRASNYRRITIDIGCGSPTCDVTAAGRLELKGLGVVAKGKGAIKLLVGGKLQVKFTLTKPTLKKIAKFRKKSKRNKARKFTVVVNVKSTAMDGKKDSGVVKVTTP